MGSYIFSLVINKYIVHHHPSTSIFLVPVSEIEALYFPTSRGRYQAAIGRSTGSFECQGDADSYIDSTGTTMVLHLCDNSFCEFLCFYMTTLNQIYKSDNAPVTYPTMHHSEQKCAYFCSEWCAVGCETCVHCGIGLICYLASWWLAFPISAYDLDWFGRLLNSLNWKKISFNKRDSLPVVRRSQIPQCIRQISHCASFCNKNVHTCAHFC